MSMWSSRIPNLEVSTVLPVLCGREGEENEGEQPGEGGTGAGEKKSAEKSKDAGNSEGESQGDPQKKIAAQDEIIARKQRQLEELTPELEELRKYREEAENAKLSEKERIDKQIEALEKSQSAKDLALQKLVIHNNFLAANDVVWHDAETALSLLDTSGFEIVTDENGIPAVKDKAAFKKAIAKLAADKPYLVKTSNADEDDDAGKGKGPKQWTGGKTGDAPKPGKQSDAAADRARLLQKYPALRGRS